MHALTSSTVIDQDIWRKGVLLENAVWTYATDAEARILEELPGSVFMHDIVSSIGQTALSFAIKHQPEFKSDYIELQRRAEETKRRVERSKAAAQQICERLLDGLENGQFELYGYALPRRAKDPAVRIPEDLYYKRYIDGDLSRVKGHGLEFVAVVILEANSEPQIDIRPDDKPLLITGPQKRGPLSSQNAIEHAVRFLMARCLLPNNKMQKQNIDLVRQCVRQLYPGEFPRDRGLGRESIRKVLAGVIRARKLK